jgi:lysozyme family protein
MATFDLAFEFMLSHEDAARSGVVTHDADGRTRFGICERFHPTLPEDFWTGPADSALIRATYKRDYWEPMRLDEIVDQAVASKIFDMCVPIGIKEAGILAQRAANGLLLGSTKAPSIDGVIGDKSIAALNACPPSNLVETLCNLSKIFFCEVAAKNPDKQKDLHGWLNRAASVPPHAIGATA